MTDGDRAIVRNMAYEVCKEWTKVHMETCAWGQAIREMKAKLAGIKIGIVIGAFMAGLGGGVGIAKVLSVF